ncbi:transcription factor SPT20 homolog [Antedon mediterranea]|uniref:transcription factor SPT20 homolog n=1 Tax=Antedon mediterranea TaxID=105859 RepID=UPI003AF7BD4A
MKQNLEEAIARAEEIIDHVRNKPSRQKYSSSSTAKWKSLPQNLYDLYVEEIQKDPENKKVRYGCHLLDKLANRDREKLQWRCLIVNLYPANQGYSLMLPGKEITESETVKLPYAESEFLDFIDNEELPPILVDLIEHSHPFLFYNGCIIAEVKDYRQSLTGQSYASRHVLLRPTQQVCVHSK